MRRVDSDAKKDILIAGNNERQNKKQDGGKLGEWFGANTKNASIHIAFVICFILLIICLCDLVHSFCSNTTLTSEIWDLIFPVITLALGYIFGKGE